MLMSFEFRSATIHSHPTNPRAEKMTYEEQRPELDPATIILGLGYATSLLVTIGWVATLVL